MSASPSRSSLEVNARKDIRVINLVADRRGSDVYLGFNIRGGSEYGLGVFVSSVTDGSIADISGFEVGDQILDINGKDFKNITHEDAVEFIQKFNNLSVTVKSSSNIPNVDQLDGSYRWIENDGEIVMEEEFGDINGRITHEKQLPTAHPQLLIDDDLSLNKSVNPVSPYHPVEVSESSQYIAADGSYPYYDECLSDANELNMKVKHKSKKRSGEVGGASIGKRKSSRHSYKSGSKVSNKKNSKKENFKGKKRSGSAKNKDQYQNFIIYQRDSLVRTLQDGLKREFDIGETGTIMQFLSMYHDGESVDTLLNHVLKYFNTAQRFQCIKDLRKLIYADELNRFDEIVNRYQGKYLFMKETQNQEVSKKAPSQKGRSQTHKKEVSKKASSQKGRSHTHKKDNSRKTKSLIEKVQPLEEETHPGVGTLETEDLLLRPVEVLPGTNPELATVEKEIVLLPVEDIQTEEKPLEEEKKEILMYPVKSGYRQKSKVKSIKKRSVQSSAKGDTFVPQPYVLYDNTLQPVQTLEHDKGAIKEGSVQSSTKGDTFVPQPYVLYDNTLQPVQALAHDNKGAEKTVEATPYTQTVEVTKKIVRKISENKSSEKSDLKMGNTIVTIEKAIDKNSDMHGKKTSRVKLDKRSDLIGLSIAGGADSRYQQDIRIVSIHPNSAASKAGLKVGQTLVSVENVSMMNTKHHDACKIIREKFRDKSTNQMEITVADGN